MYVFSIESENFRGLPNLSLRLDKKLNVFVGNNGVGKSSLLDLLTFMISQYRILSDETLSFKPSDVQNGKDDFSCRIVCHLEKSDSYILAKYAVNKTSTSAMYFENKSGSFDDAGSPFGPLHVLYDELKEEELPFTKNYPTRQIGRSWRYRSVFEVSSLPSILLMRWTTPCLVILIFAHLLHFSVKASSLSPSVSLLCLTSIPNGWHARLKPSIPPSIKLSPSSVSSMYCTSRFVSASGRTTVSMRFFSSLTARSVS